jgi:uroporphyrinogen decarboxylase
LRPVVFDDGNHYQIQCETGAKVDCYRMPVSNTHYYDQPIRSHADLDNFHTPSLDDPRRYEGVKETIDRYHQAGCFVAVHVLGTFQGSNLMMRPFTDLLMDIVADPEFAAQLMEVYTNFLIEDVCRRLEMGADGVYVCDDLGMNDKLMMRPIQYRKIIKPLHQKQVQRFKQFPDVKVMFHCDGCVRDIMDDLVEVGFDEINPVDPSDHMFIEELKPKYGEQITLAGGFDRHIGQMKLDELMEHIENVIAIGKPGGRYIATFPIYPEMDFNCMLQGVRRIEELSTYTP